MNKKESYAESQRNDVKRLTGSNDKQQLIKGARNVYNVKGRSFFNFTTMSKDDPKIKSKNVVACDSAAGFSVFKDISLFPQGVWKSEKEVFISGIQKGAEPIKVTMEGNTIFGVIGYSKEADINVLSLADIQENCSDWHGYGDSIYVRQGDKTYKFTKGNDRIFIWEPNDGVTDNNNSFAVASVTTVTEIKKTIYTPTS